MRIRLDEEDVESKSWLVDELIQIRLDAGGVESKSRLVDELAEIHSSVIFFVLGDIVSCTLFPPVRFFPSATELSPVLGRWL